jgi:hypothetical protein
VKATPAKKEPIAVKNGSHGAAAKKGKDDNSSSESSEDESSDDEVNFNMFCKILEKLLQYILDKNPKMTSL